MAVTAQQADGLVVLAVLAVFILLLVWGAGQRNAREARARIDLMQQRASQYDTVVQNVSQGVCLYDAQDSLLFANRPFLELYGLPAECARPGTPFDHILRHAVMLGHFPDRNLEQVLWDRLNFVARRLAGTTHETLAGGRTVEIHHTPTEAGGWVATYTDITLLRRAEQEWRFARRHDLLTRLPNRAYFCEALEFVLGEPILRWKSGVLAIGIERLERVTGLFGHAVGERLLQYMAQRIQGCTRRGDRVGRVSDDVFAVLRPGLASQKEAEHLAQQIITVLSAPVDIDGQRLRITVAIGVALAPGLVRDAAVRAPTWLAYAELAMRRAAHEGPGRAQMFQPEMEQRERAHLRVEHELAGAIEREEFEVFYQPLIDLRTRRIASFEALVRWRHPVDGLLLPGMFIPVAEASGLMAALGRFVLRRACRDAVSWPPDIRVAVNMSATQLRSITALEMVKSALLEAWLPPKRLEIELTESHFLDRGSEGVAVLQALRELGLRIALDDFGTGYASLSSLMDFRFDKIKIDRSFIEGMMEHPQRLEIVRAMIRLAGSLGIGVVAEGVQSTEQLALLKAEGCAEVQSFLLGAPMPAAAVADVLQRQEVLQALVA